VSEAENEPEAPLVAEPDTPTPDERSPQTPVAGVEEGLAGPLADAQAQLGPHSQSQEWRRIAEIVEASRALWKTIRGAAGSYRREVLADLRVQGFWRSFTARSARAIAVSANGLARGLDRGSALTVRTLRRLGRAANDYADRLQGNLPPGRSLQTAADLKQGLAELDAMLDQPSKPATGGPSPRAALLESSMRAVRQAFAGAAAAVSAAGSAITETAAWQRLAAVWNGASSVVNRVHQGALRFERDAFAMGFLGAVWTRTCETLAWGARQAMEHMADNDRRLGITWQALRLLHHTAEESIAHLRDQLPRDQHAPLGTYDPPSIAEAAARALQEPPQPHAGERPDEGPAARRPAAPQADSAVQPGGPDRAAAYQEMIEVLDALDLARQHGELDGGFAAVAQLTEQAAARMGLQRFGAPGDAFDPRRHDGVGLSNPDREPSDTPIAVEVVRTGYTVDGQVIRPASVMLGEPEDLAAQAQQARDLMAVSQLGAFRPTLEEMTQMPTTIVARTPPGGAATVHQSNSGDLGR
jgi:hypothetical protein